MPPHEFLDNRFLIVVCDVGRDGRVTGSLHEHDRRGDGALGEDGIDVVPESLGGLAPMDVALNDINPDDVSFRIRSPHRAEASLCMPYVLCFCGHFSLKKARRLVAAGFGWLVVITGGATRLRAWVLPGVPISGPVFHPADRLMLDLPITEAQTFKPLERFGMRPSTLGREACRDAETGCEGNHRPPRCVQQKDSLSKQVGPHMGQYMHPQEFVGVSVHHQLHEPACFSHHPGPGATAPFLTSRTLISTDYEQ